MVKAGDTILTLNGGKKTTGLDWQKVEAAGLDEASLATRTGVAREELFSLMANDKGIDFGTSYDKAKEKTVGDYDYSIAKEADAAKGAVTGTQGVSLDYKFRVGASAMLELGYRFTPKKSRVSYDVNLSGWQGKREGFSGSIGVNWAF